MAIPEKAKKQFTITTDSKTYFQNMEDAQFSESLWNDFSLVC